MPDNEFLPFAAAAGSNVADQDQWRSLPDRLTGFTRGTARSPYVNKAIRQGAAMAAALGLFAASRGPLSALDNGDIGGLELSLASAFAQLDHLCSYAGDLGTVNNVVLNLVPAPGTYLDGMVVKFVPGSTNTDQSALNLNGMGNRPLLRRDASPLQPGDLLQGSPQQAIYLGGPSTGAFRLLSPAQSEFAKVIFSPIFYVRPDGNDNNDGSANTPQKAFATIQGAILNGTNKITLAGRTASIILGIPGTYTAPSFPGVYANAEASLQSAGTLLIQGNIANQGAYIISGSGAPATSGILHFSYGSQAILRGVTIYNTSSGAYHSLVSSTTSAVYAEYCTFGGTGLTNSHIYSADGAVIKLGPGNSLASNAQSALFAQGGGITQMGGAPISIQGSPSITNFAVSQYGGRILCPGAAGFNGGAVTGRKYLSQFNAVIAVFGAGDSYFPGNTAGTYNNGGIYV